MKREMKDSGIPWIGEIPEDWKFARIGSLYGLRVEKVSDLDFQPLSVTKLGIVPQLETTAKTNAHDDRKLVKVGDFVINSRSDRRGSCGISVYEGSVSLINTVLYPIAKMNTQYYNWLFHTKEFADEFYRWGHGIVDDLWTTGWQDMKNIVIVQPALSEQHRITDYLDAKCAEIDALAADIQSEIDTLEQYKRSVITETVTKGLNPDAEMKDSGIPWIGKIPVEWKTSRIKYLPELRQENNFVDGDWIESLDLVDSGIRYLTTGNIGDGNFKRQGDGYVTEETFYRLHCKFAYPGDLVIARLNAPFGRACLLPDDFEKYVLAVDIVILRPRESRKFLCYVTQCSGYQIAVEDKARGTTMRRISRINLGNIYVPIPPASEQRRIADFLDAKCAEIDSTVAEKRKQLETLDAYKKSLIFEYVTGKKEVPTV